MIFIGSDAVKSLTTATRDHSRYDLTLFTAFHFIYSFITFIFLGLTYVYMNMMLFHTLYTIYTNYSASTQTSFHDITLRSSLVNLTTTVAHIDYYRSVTSTAREIISKQKSDGVTRYVLLCGAASSKIDWLANCIINDTNYIENISCASVWTKSRAINLNPIFREKVLSLAFRRLRQSFISKIQNSCNQLTYSYATMRTLISLSFCYVCNTCDIYLNWTQWGIEKVT